MAIGEVGVAHLDLAVDPVDEEVHPAQPPGEILRLLSVEREPPTVLCELVGLNEHPSGPATRVVDRAPLWLQERDQRANDASRREELAAPLPLGAGERPDEVLVDT